MQKTLNQILRDLNQKYNVPQKVILAIGESPFKFTREQLKDNDIEKEKEFKNFRYPYLGQLCTTPERIVAIRKTIKKKNEHRRGK